MGRATIYIGNTMTNEERQELKGTIMRGNVGVLLTLVVQTFTAIWAISGLFTRVDLLTGQVLELRGDFKTLRDRSYPISDALKDSARFETMLGGITIRIDRIEERVRSSEQKLSNNYSSGK